MGVHMEIVDLNHLFLSQTSTQVLANTIPTDTKEGQEQLNRLLYTKYAGDSLANVPTCECGELSGEYNIGTTCHLCNTVCENPIDRTIQTKVWVQVPRGIPAFINPTAWILLSKAMTKSYCNVLQWLCDPYYKVPSKEPPMLVRLKKCNVERGIKNFYENFDEIFRICFPVSRARREGANDIITFVEQNRSKIFCQYLPMPSNVSFVVETNDTGRYADTTMAYAIDALRTITSIDTGVLSLPHKRIESRVSTALNTLGKFYEQYVYAVLGKKKGILRHHVFGGRLAWTGRAVISSLSQAHDYQRIKLPWSMSVQLLQQHITAKLLWFTNLTPAQIERKITRAIVKFDEDIGKIIHQLIDESPYPGLPVIIHRNPTLKRGSAQLMYADVKFDPNDKTISMPPTAIKAPNADYDGDEMNILVINDKEMHDRLYRLSPHLGTLDLGKPRAISGNLAMPSPMATTLANWLNELPLGDEDGNYHSGGYLTS